MIVMNVTYHCKKGCTQKFLDALEKNKIYEKVNNEPDCIGYEYYLPLKEDGTVKLIEHWPNEEALEKHKKYEHFFEIQKIKEEYIESTDFEKSIIV